MKRYSFAVKVIIGLLFSCLLAGLIYSRSRVSAVKRGYRSDESVAWDFGKVKEGSVVKHVFNFKNDSAKELKIVEVGSSCGCTVSKVNKNDLSPGEEAAIEVSFNSKGYSGETKQFVYVHTDNLDNPVVRFIIKALVEK